MIITLTGGFEEQFTSLGENTEKCITFPVKKVIRISKNGEEIKKIISYRFKFIDSSKLHGRLIIESC